MELLDNVKYAHLKSDQKELADLLGMDVFLTLVQKCGGTRLYIPKADSIGRAARNDMIRNDFTGDNINELAAMYRLTDSQIRVIVSPKNKN